MLMLNKNTKASGYVSAGGFWIKELSVRVIFTATLYVDTGHSRFWRALRLVSKAWFHR